MIHTNFPFSFTNHILLLNVPKSFFLTLSFFILFYTEAFCQNLYLKIEGGNVEETQIINASNYKKRHKDFESISTELKTLQNQFYQDGYIESELKFANKINDSTVVGQFQLHTKYKSIHIYYNKSAVDTSILNLVSPAVFETYFELDFKNIEDALTIINSKITEKGFPFSKLKLSNIQMKQADILKADLIIESIEKSRIINAIKVEGYEKFPKSFLKHYLKIKPKQNFNLNLIKKKTAQLNNLKFASQIKDPEVLFTKDSTTLYLYLEKTKSNAFDGFLGFGNDETTGNIQFDGYLNLNLTNNLNYGESFRLLYKSDENDQQTFKTDVTLPYIFKSPLGVDLQLQIFKQDTSFVTVNQFAKLHYQIHPKHKVYSGIIGSESNSLLDENFSTTIIDYKTSYYSFAYEYLNWQNFNLLFPLSAKFYLETNFGKRKQGNTSENQSQFILDAFKIFNLNNKNSIYLRANGATLLSNTYLENELFRFGGINSIRGFEENSLLASQFGVLNTEYRYKLSNGVYINSIIDAAFFENQILNIKEQLYGYGFGFGLLTKAGLFRFNYANGKLENQKFKLSNSKVHISLTTNF